MKIAVFAAVGMIAMIATANAAEIYKVQVTRKDQDLYEVVGQGNTIYIKTAYCYEYAMWEEAVVILKSQAFSGSIAIGKLIFLNGYQMCQIDTILR